MDNSLFEQIANDLAEGFVILDQDLRIRFWNRWMTEAAGVDSGVACGETLDEVFGADRVATRLRYTCKEALEHGAAAVLSRAFTPHPLPLTSRQGTGGRMVQSIRIRPLRSPSGDRYCSLEIRDDTLEYSREQLLQEPNRRLNVAIKELEAFSYRVSHDLKAPLRHLRTLCQFLVEDAGENVPEECNGHIERIFVHTTRMSGIVDDLLSLSHAGHGKMTVTEVSLAQCVDNALAHLTAEITRTGARVSIADDLPVIVGDAGFLNQLFQNLIGNALKFVREDVPHVRVTLEHGPDGPIVGVQDNGIGLKPEQAESAFEAFKRLHGSSFEGTGLGLSICRRIIDRHGGRIWVESPAEGGAHFRFSLPVSDAAAA